MSDLAPLEYAGLVDDLRDIADVARSLMSADPQNGLAGADEGWFGIGLPEEIGGAGGSLSELAPIVEAAGALGSATAVPWSSGIVGRLFSVSPFAETVVRSLSEGNAVAIPVEGPGVLADRITSDSLSASGTFLTLGAIDAPLALPVRIGGVDSVVLLPASDRGQARPVTGFDRTRGWARVTLDDVPLTGLPVTSGDDVFERWSQLAAVVFALDAVGAARTALSRTITYSETREQFGRAIGSFQAYKHRLANAFIDLKLGQALAFRTVASQGTDEFPQLAYSAAIQATSAATRVCGEAIQLHGGMGFTWEAGLHLLLRRARADEILAKGGSTALDGVKATW